MSILAITELSPGSSSRRRACLMSSNQQPSYASVWPWRMRVFEVPRLALVRPVVGVEAVRFAPVRDRGVVVAGAVQVLTELEVGGGAGLVVGASTRATHHFVGRERVRLAAPFSTQSSIIATYSSGSLLILRASRSISAMSSGTCREVHVAERLGDRVAPRVRRLGGPHDHARPRRSTRRSAR